MQQLTFMPGRLTLNQLRQIQQQPVKLVIEPEALSAVQASADTVQQLLSQGQVIYGVNTGFGLLANTRISPDELELLQRSIVLSHAAGTGEFMQDSTVRLMMALKINSLARGYSGIRPEVLQSLVTLFNHQIWPCVPEKGSVGASGDLAPLAHMSAVLLGEGFARYQGEVVTAAEALARARLKPLALAPKEGLALLNGTQASTAFALEGLFAAEDLYASATVSGALSVEAALGSRRPFDPRIHDVRGHKGQIDAAAAYRHLLTDETELSRSHAKCEKVQDPYSLRCQPQVMGACLQQIRSAAEVLQTEANAVSDNPLVFSGDSLVISGGNFHAEPVAFAADNLALAISEIGALSERRSALLIDSQLSGLPPFLVDNGGVNSGFMLAQVTAAALASENKTLAHPASVDSLPTSANQEDHVSMATFAGRRLRDMAQNSAGVVAIELLEACQGVDMRTPHQSSELLEQAKQTLRKVVSFYDKDRYFAPDIALATSLVQSGQYNQLMPVGLLPSLG